MMRPLGTLSLMAWAYVPISTLRFVEVKLLEEALVTNSKLGTAEGFGVFLFTRPFLPLDLPEITNTSRNRALCGERKIEMVLLIREFDFRLLPVRAKRVMKPEDLGMHRRTRGEQLLFDY
jgi:hypothetical protein